MDYGEWTENSRGTYNKWDGIARSTIQVLTTLQSFVVNVILKVLKGLSNLVFWGNLE